MAPDMNMDNDELMMMVVAPWRYMASDPSPSFAFQALDVI